MNYYIMDFNLNIWAGLITILVFLITIYSIWKNKKKILQNPKLNTSIASNSQSLENTEYFEVDTGLCHGNLASLSAPEAVTDDILENFQQHIQRVPCLPSVWNEVQYSIERGDSAVKISSLIYKDPGLATEVLKAANSKGFEVDKEVTDLNQAIVRVGFQALRGIIMNYCTTDFSKRWCSPFSIQQLWKHAMAVSVLSTVTAKYVKGCDVGVASTLGLLHDIGRIGLNSICQDAFHYPPDPEQGFLQYEYEHFGCNHLDAGLLLAKHWNLPERLQQGIACHHQPGLGDMQMIAEDIRAEVLAVYLADYLAIHFGFAGGNKLLVPPHCSFAAMMKAPLNKIAHDKAVSKELWRVQAIEF